MGITSSSQSGKYSSLFFTVLKNSSPYKLRHFCNKNLRKDFILQKKYLKKSKLLNAGDHLLSKYLTSLSSLEQFVTECGVKKESHHFSIAVQELLVNVRKK